MKIIYSDPKIGKTNQIEITNDLVHYLVNKKIGEIIDGSMFGLTGFKLKITGGSDKSGFPMNKSIDSAIKTKILKRNKGKYQRKSVRGKIISNEIEQINTVIVEYGSKPINELFKIEEKLNKESIVQENNKERKQKMQDQDKPKAKEQKSEEQQIKQEHKEIKK